MASGDFTDLKQRACQLSRRNPADSGDLARAAEAINEGLLSTLLDGTTWDVLQAQGTFTVTSAADTYTQATISATLDEVLVLVDDTSGNVLDPLDWESLESAARSTQDTEPIGQPASWAKWGQGATAIIRLFPKPDASYTLRWFGRITVAELVNAGDPNPIPLAWRHRLLVPYAAARLLRIESGYASAYEASGLEASYQQALQLFRIAHGSARFPIMGVQSPGFGRDLPPVDATEYGWVF